MDIQAEKLTLLKAIMDTNDSGLIMDVKAVVDSHDNDWFIGLSKSQQADVSEGLDEADKGEVVSHEEVVKLFGKWGLK